MNIDVNQIVKKLLDEIVKVSDCDDYYEKYLSYDFTEKLEKRLEKEVEKYCIPMVERFIQDNKTVIQDAIIEIIPDILSKVIYDTLCNNLSDYIRTQVGYNNNIVRSQIRDEIRSRLSF